VALPGISETCTAKCAFHARSITIIDVWPGGAVGANAPTQGEKKILGVEFMGVNCKCSPEGVSAFSLEGEESYFLFNLGFWVFHRHLDG